ncbi:MAG: AAA family ATPase [Planctomycetales bacterium]|nr:AAA family ATPase [Planctomycetales bacterium]
MRITDLHISSFGHWNGLQIANFSDQITVIHGPNEAGKSTLLQFVRAVLYGFSPTRHRRFVPPVYEGRVGGSVTVSAPNGQFTVRRLLPKSGRLEDHEPSELSVCSTDGRTQGNHVLNTLLSGVDDSIFHNVFAVGLTEMQHLGTLSDTDAGQQLYGLAMGADRVSLVDVKRELEVARQSLLSSDDSTSELPTLFERRDLLKREIQAAADDNRRWNAILEERSSAEKEIAELEKERNSFLGQGQLKEVTAQLRRHWKEAQELHTQLKRLGNIPKDAVTSLGRIRKISSDLAERRAKSEEVKKQRSKLRDKASSFRTGESLSAHVAEIEQMHNRRGKIKNLHADIKRLEQETEEAEFELQSELERLGIQSAYRPESAPAITPELIEELRVPWRQTFEAERECNDARREATEYRRQAEVIERQLQAVSQSTGTTNFGQRFAALERTMQALRQRMQLDTREEKLRRTIKSLHGELKDWRERQVLPWRALMVLGFVFSAGAAMAGVALLGEYMGIADESRRVGLGLTGGLTCLVAFIIKNNTESGAIRGEEACEDELDDLQKQLDETQKQIREANEHLPPSSDTLVARLQDTEAQLAEMEEYVPLEGQRKELAHEADAAERREQLAKQKLKDAKSHWSSILRDSGFPDTISIDQFEVLSGKTGAIDRIRERWTLTREQLQQRQQELQQLQHRVESLVTAAQLISDDDELESQITLLFKTVRDQRQQDEQRESLHRQWRQLGRDQEKIAEAAKRLQEKRNQLMEHVGVVDQDDLNSLLKRSRKAKMLTKNLDELVKQIVAAMDGQTTAREIRQQLDRDQFLNRLKKMESKHDSVHNRLEELYQRRAELTESNSSLISRRDVSGKRIELSEVEAKIANGIRRWQAYATTSAVLDEVRRTYESDRQPETLAEASNYLELLTRGRYTRIWTPFGESSLSVNDKHGKALPVEVLSRGTREQVFLSLRMALVANYSRRGARLPLILDDVFVNFDRERAVAAAEAICQFAQQGHQVLLFTCHEHIRQIFEDLEVDVCELPRAADLAHGAGQPIVPQKGIPVRSTAEQQTLVAPAAPATDDASGPIYYYLTADELAEIAYNDDFFGDDGTFYPLAGARVRSKVHRSMPQNARPISEFVAKKEQG